MADFLSAYAFHWGQTLRTFCIVLCTVAMLKVTLTTVAELYNDDDNTINHHGFTRKVGMEEEKVNNAQYVICLSTNFVYNSRLASIMKWKRKYQKLLVGIVLLNLICHKYSALGRSQSDHCIFFREKSCSSICSSFHNDILECCNSFICR